MKATRRGPDEFRAEQDAKKQEAKGATLFALNELRVEQEQHDVSDDRLETIAKEIETLQATAAMRIAERLAEAHKIFRYRRDEGGFGGWVERRLRYSRDTAYNLLHIHERFGQSVENFDTLGRSVLYLLTKPSTPESARQEILDRAKAGERFSVNEIKETIREHKAPKLPVDSRHPKRHLRWTALLYRHHQRDRIIWCLVWRGGSEWLTYEVITDALASGNIVGVGDTLFEDAPSQTYQYVE